MTDSEEGRIDGARMNDFQRIARDIDRRLRSAITYQEHALIITAALRDASQAGYAQAVEDLGWDTVATAPLGIWLRTKRVGETGENITQRIADDEWADRQGRTTVTHSTFLPPTHWQHQPNNYGAAGMVSFAKASV